MRSLTGIGREFAPGISDDSNSGASGRRKAATPRNVADWTERKAYVHITTLVDLSLVFEFSSTSPAALNSPGKRIRFFTPSA